VGTREASKNVQKILTKNINSLKIKRIIPNLKPSITKKLWYPLKPSEKISMPQEKPIKVIDKREKIKEKENLNLNQKTNDEVKPKDAKKE